VKRPVTSQGLWLALVRQRKMMRLSQTDVAMSLGVGQQIVSRWESGHTEATLTTVGRYARAVGARVQFTVIVAEGFLPVINEPAVNEPTARGEG
jgi:transcriptional regulator with XRE-family HTH domain